MAPGALVRDSLLFWRTEEVLELGVRLKAHRLDSLSISSLHGTLHEHGHPCMQQMQE